MSEDGRVLVIWQGKVMHGHQTVYSRVDTTIKNILQVLGELGKTPDYFNNMIVSTAVGKSWRPILFVNGSYFGLIRDALFDRGLGKPVWITPK